MSEYVSCKDMADLWSMYGPNEYCIPKAGGRQESVAASGEDWSKEKTQMWRRKKKNRLWLQIQDKGERAKKKKKTFPVAPAIATSLVPWLLNLLAGIWLQIYFTSSCLQRSICLPILRGCFCRFAMSSPATASANAASCAGQLPPPGPQAFWQSAFPKPLWFPGPCPFSTSLQQ